MTKKKKTATLPLDSEAPEGYTAEQIAAVSAEDDHARLHAAEALVTLLAQHEARRIAAFVVPDGVTEIVSNGSKFRGDEPDPLVLLDERLRRWTLSTNYAHYSVCADGITMFGGNFDEYSAAFTVYTRTGSDADRWLTALMHANPGWQASRVGDR